MTRLRLFGTDGIRGVANEEPLTPELAYRVGRQLAVTLRAEHDDGRVRLVLGRDTRRSGPLLESALTAGALSAGADCYAVGVLPTPGIALLTRTLEAHGGVAFTASHNAFQDNGIKLLAANGAKFPEAWEAEIEAALGGRDVYPRARREHIGRLVTYDRAEDDYVEFLCRRFPLDLHGMTVALDCAHGATYRVGPRVFRRLGALVAAMGAAPTGVNINDGVGALYPEGLSGVGGAAARHRGFAFDGDGDRLIAVDHTGSIRDGDHVLAVASRHPPRRGACAATSWSPRHGQSRPRGGPERGGGSGWCGTQVGDRHVLEAMQHHGPTGGRAAAAHMPYHAPAGDGSLRSGLLLAVVAETGQSLASWRACASPQVLRNVPVARRPPLESLAGLPLGCASSSRRWTARGGSSSATRAPSLWPG